MFRISSLGLREQPVGDDLVPIASAPIGQRIVDLGHGDHVVGREPTPGAFGELVGARDDRSEHGNVELPSDATGLRGVLETLGLGCAHEHHGGGRSNRCGRVRPGAGWTVQECQRAPPRERRERVVEVDGVGHALCGHDLGAARVALAYCATSHEVSERRFTIDACEPVEVGHSRIEVDGSHPGFAVRQRSRDGERGRRLATAALSACDRDHTPSSPPVR